MSFSSKVLNAFDFGLPQNRDRLFIVGIRSFIKKNLRTAIVSFIFSGLFLFWFLNSSTIPNEFVFFTPHITTLIVLSFASQRLRMPKFIGKAYKKGELN